MKVIALVGVTIFSSFYFNLQAGEVNYNYDPKSIRKVELESESAEILIKGTKKKMAALKVEKVSFPDFCYLDFSKTGTRLVIKSGKKKGESARRGECKVKIFLELTSSLRQELQLDLMNGPVKFENLTFKKIKFKLMNGQLKGEDLIVKELKGSMGNGFLKIIGMVEQGKIDLANGNVELDYTNLPSTGKGKLEINSGSGNATLFLPESANISASLESGWGKLNNEFGIRKMTDTNLKVKMKTGVGNLEIRKRKS